MTASTGQLERPGIEKFLGMASAAVLVCGLVIGIRWLQSPTHADTLFFTIALQATLLLNTLILYWPFHINRVMGFPTAKALLVAASGLLVLNLILTAIPWVREFSGLTEFFSDIPPIFGWIYLTALALVFFTVHVLMYRFIRHWLAAPWAHWVGMLGYAIAAYLYIASVGDTTLTRRLATEFMRNDFGSFLGLYLLFYAVIQYLFVTLLPVYTAALFAPRRFRVSAWMHVAYIYMGVSGFLGFMTAILYAFVHPSAA